MWNIHHATVNRFTRVNVKYYVLSPFSCDIKHNIEQIHSNVFFTFVLYSLLMVSDDSWAAAGGPSQPDPFLHKYWWEGLRGTMWITTGMEDSADQSVLL